MYLGRGFLSASLIREIENPFADKHDSAGLNTVGFGDAIKETEP